MNWGSAARKTPGVIFWREWEVVGSVLWWTIDSGEEEKDVLMFASGSKLVFD